MLWLRRSARRQRPGSRPAHSSELAAMDKVDLTKVYRQLYRPSAEDFELVEVPPLTYLMADGHGDPNTAPAYAEAVEALYALAYRLKFLSKGELDRDYVVPPLEGLWWADDYRSYTTGLDKSKWAWTMMILAPEWITPELVGRAIDEVRRKKAPPALATVRLERYEEGLAAQILHIGSYADEAPALARLHQQWIPQHGYVEHGKHHEIYLSDPRRVEAAKLKTVLRQPIRKA
jgi:hypothetical protein